MRLWSLGWKIWTRKTRKTLRGKKNKRLRIKPCIATLRCFCLLDAKEQMTQDEAGWSVKARFWGLVMHQTSRGPPPRRWDFSLGTVLKAILPDKHQRRCTTRILQVVFKAAKALPRQEAKQKVKKSSTHLWMKQYILHFPSLVEGRARGVHL